MPAYLAKAVLIAKLLLLLLLVIAVPAAVLLLVCWLHLGELRANHGKARTAAGGRLEFPPARSAIIRWLWEVWFFGCGTAALVVEICRGRIGWMLLYLALFPLLFAHKLTSFPGSITTGVEGLEQIFWLRSNKKIRWIEVSSIQKTDKGRAIRVAGSDGTEIVHPRRLADQPRFLCELEAHCRADLLKDFQNAQTPR
jgi:hypothetical protein